MDRHPLRVSHCNGHSLWVPYEDDYNVITETIQNQRSHITTHHVWGKDLSGTRGGAGGVGGLLATRIGGAWYFPLYDANGNVTDYVDSNGNVVAHREYDPFGKTVIVA